MQLETHIKISSYRKRKGELVIQNNHHGKIIGKSFSFSEIKSIIQSGAILIINHTLMFHQLIYLTNQLIKHNWEIISISFPSPIW